MYSMSASELAVQCMRTPATLSVRIARLERDGFVRRSADPRDGRAAVIGLTDAGLRLIDEVAPAYLDVEKLALSALADSERSSLADALQQLLLSFEDFDVDLGGGQRIASVPSLGLGLESLHRTMSLRRAVGVADRTGMLVAMVAPAGPADQAGVARGDLLVEVDGEPATSASILNHRLAERTSTYVTMTLAREGDGDRTVRVQVLPPRSANHPTAAR